MPVYHILNGDSLLEKFPDALSGDTIVARECMIDGPVRGNSIKEVYKTRKRFFKKEYEDSEDGFEKKVKAEINKILDIESGSEINLWFEDDLFCQANLWFIVWIIASQLKDFKVFLIRPENDMRYGFGGYHSEELMELYEKKSLLDELQITLISALWEIYQTKHVADLRRFCDISGGNVPFAVQAIKAEIENLTYTDGYNKSEQLILELIKKHGKNNFAEIFRDFSNESGVYGYGDMQVMKKVEQLSKK